MRVTFLKSPSTWQPVHLSKPSDSLKRGITFFFASGVSLSNLGRFFGSSPRAATLSSIALVCTGTFGSGPGAGAVAIGADAVGAGAPLAPGAGSGVGAGLGASARPGSGPAGPGVGLEPHAAMVAAPTASTRASVGSLMAGACNRKRRALVRIVA